MPLANRTYSPAEGVTVTIRNITNQDYYDINMWYKRMETDDEVLNSIKNSFVHCMTVTSDVNGLEVPIVNAGSTLPEIQEAFRWWMTLDHEMTTKWFLRGVLGYEAEKSEDPKA